MAVEPSADPLCDFGSLRHSKVDVPAVQTAVIPAARAAIDCRVRRSKERESAQRVIVDRVCVGIGCQSAAVIMHGRTLVLVAANREVRAAVSKHGALAQLLT